MSRRLDPDCLDVQVFVEMLQPGLASIGPKQSWDNTDLGGPWLNGMRNTVNAQVWSFRQPDFLCVSGTHGSAHLALYDQATWDKYQLAKIAGANTGSNTFITLPPASAHDAADFQATDGAFSSKNNSIAALQRRGVVFLACHNAIWKWQSGWWRQARIPTISASKPSPPN
jgi:hypothetical protein